MKLENIGFYTLCDNRIEQASTTFPRSPLWRCELILTDRCNFKCPYCRGLRSDCKGTMNFDTATKILAMWIGEGLKNVRFSGGEPTLYEDLPDLVKQAKLGGVEHIAISTNGSAPTFVYDMLVNLGVNDFSISLDACCAEDADKMAGKEIDYDRVIENIRHLSGKAYVTVGVVLTPDNIGKMIETVELADALGVKDIRIISAAQSHLVLEAATRLPQGVIDRHPILKYRIENIKNGRDVRGIKEGDSNQCPLVTDDMAIAGDYHFPCIIYLREGGDPIGKVGSTMRTDRIKWYETHDTHADPICKNNCLDVCIDYNNRWRDIKGRDT